MSRIACTVRQPISGFPTENVLKLTLMASCRLVIDHPVQHDCLVFSRRARVDVICGLLRELGALWANRSISSIFIFVTPGLEQSIRCRFLITSYYHSSVLVRHAAPLAAKSSTRAFPWASRFMYVMLQILRKEPFFFFGRGHDTNFSTLFYSGSITVLLQ